MNYTKIIILIVFSLFANGCYMAEFTPGLNGNQKRFIRNFNENSDRVKRIHEHEESMYKMEELQSQIDSLMIEIKKCQNN